MNIINKFMIKLVNQNESRTKVIMNTENSQYQIYENSEFKNIANQKFQNALVKNRYLIHIY